MNSQNHAKKPYSGKEKRRFAGQYLAGEGRQPLGQDEKISAVLQKRLARQEKVPYVPLLYGGSSSVGRASGCGPEGREFKSLLSPHFACIPVTAENLVLRGFLFGM